MSGVAKRIRWSRFLGRSSGRGIIVPIDHGLTIGPVEGLHSVSQVAGWIGHPGITGVIAHKGMVERLGREGLLRGVGVMVHLNGMMSLAQAPDTKERLTSVEAALRLGADAVSLQLNFDGTNDAHNLRMLGEVVDEAQRYNLPVLTMLYDKAQCADEEQGLGRQKHLMRACAELGTDALKLSAPADLALVPELMGSALEHTAVFFAGGALRSEEDILRLAEVVVQSGATGLCVGRNVFQRASVASALSRLQSILHEESQQVRVPVSRPVTAAGSAHNAWPQAAEEAVE